MASNKMLIDASHPEETRVVVLRGNRIEEFDFESQNKQQLKGNIYLAKVTRVEPSLQAAFVDYGGNRHGFLAFNEIHPDYYQIPVADRQALLDEEAEDARLDKLEDDELDNQQQSATENKAGSSGEDEVTEDEKPAPKKRKRRTRRTSRKAAAEQQDEETTDSSSEEAVAASNGEGSGEIAEPVNKEEEATPEAEAKNEEEVQAAEAEAEEKPKPRRTRRTTRRTSSKKAEQQADEETASNDAQQAENNEVAKVEAVAEEAEVEAPQDEQSDGKPTSIAAMMETDSISEPAPEDNSDDDSSQDEAEETPEQTAKPRRRTRSTSRPGKKAKAEEQQPVEEEQQPKAEENAEPGAVKAKSEAEEHISDESDTNASEEVSVTDEVKEASASDEDAVKSAEPASDEETELKSENAVDEEEKPKSKRRRRTSRSKKKEAKKADLENADEASADNGVVDASLAPQPVIDANASENDEAVELDANGDEVETSGQEDAMEEVPQRRSHRRQYKIQEVIKRRQVLLVQVVKEERGNKGAALTTYLSLAGRYSVLMPNTARGGGISRKITNSADRKRLKTIASELAVPEGMGVILRTAGASRTKEEIQRDFEYLMRLWENVRNLTLSSSAPCLVYEEGSLIKRSIRDLYDKNTGEIHVAGEAGYREAKDFMNMLMPSHSNRVHFYQDEQAMFARYGVEQQLDKMLSQQVTLKSGGYLVIDQTEALVAIDVNSGRATREHSIEDTALQTNLETAEEVARQLRLRDLAGLIVIDFIDMEEKRNNRAVEKKLKECLKHDRARIQVGRISHFGLLEMSRQRMRASVMDSTTDVCPTCGGKGHVRSNSSVCLHILRAIEEHLLKNSRFDLNIKTSMETAAYILNHKRGALSEIELRFGVKLYIEGRHDVMGENYAIEKGEISTGERVPLNHIQVGHLSDADQSDRDEKPGKKRRRRRNRGNKEDRTEEANVETKEEVSTEQPEVAAEEGEKPGKKRTRGKRGGRNKRKSKDETASADSTDNVSVEDTSENNSAETVENEVAATEAQEQERPKRRNTRRKTAKASKKADETPANDEPAELNGAAIESKDEQSGQEEAEKPKRTRRRTSRKKASAEETSESSTAENNGSEPETDTPVMEAASANEAPAVEASAADDADDKSKKRGGWWSRGGFFK